jgi:aromatic ring-opening dioxygenase LigB subunit
MLVFGAIAPHGGDMLEEIADDPRVMAKTRVAMQELGRRFAATRPDTVIVLTPHGIVVDGAISCGATPIAAGTLGDVFPKQIQAAFDTDLAMVEAIITEGAAQQIPFARLVGDNKVEDAVLPLDWGALIPLWYTAHRLTPRPEVVVLAPDRSLPRETLVRCGVAIARAAAASGKRVALIASCDQGHAHDPQGPYGYSPASAEHDTAMCAAIRETICRACWNGPRHLWRRQR